MNKKKKSFSNIYLPVSTIVFHLFLASVANANLTCAELFSFPKKLGLIEKIQQRGLGPRGYLGRKVPNHWKQNPMARHLLTEWGVEIYTATSQNKAREHDAKEAIIGRQGFYFLTKEVLTEIDKGQSAFLQADRFQKLLDSNTRLVYFEDTDGTVENRKMRIVNPRDVASFFESEDIVIRTRLLNKGVHFWRTGYAFPSALYGSFRFKSMVQKRIYKESMAIARKMAKNGYHFEFSQSLEDFQNDLDLNRQTDRKDQDPQTASRHNSKQTYENAIESFRQGNAFTIRVVNRSNPSRPVVVGGIIVFRKGNSIDFDSTFYVHNKLEIRNDPNKPESTLHDPIETVKIASYVLFSRLLAAGIDQLHISTITNFSHTLGAEKLPNVEDIIAQIELLENLPSLPFDFSSSWVPPNDAQSDAFRNRLLN